METRSSALIVERENCCFRIISQKRTTYVAKYRLIILKEVNYCWNDFYSISK